MHELARPLDPKFRKAVAERLDRLAAEAAADPAKDVKALLDATVAEMAPERPWLLQKGEGNTIAVGVPKTLLDFWKYREVCTPADAARLLGSWDKGLVDYEGFAWSLNWRFKSPLMFYDARFQDLPWPQPGSSIDRLAEWGFFPVKEMKPDDLVVYLAEADATVGIRGVPYTWARQAGHCAICVEGQVVESKLSDGAGVYHHPVSHALPDWGTHYLVLRRVEVRVPARLKGMEYKRSN